MPDALLLAARVLMAALFVAGAIPKLTGDPGERAAITQAGFPAAGLLGPLAGICQVAGAAMLLLGWETRLAAGLLAAFVVVVTPLFIRFWSAGDPALRTAMVQTFFGNAGVTGGLLALCAVGPGAIALMPGG